MSKIKSNLIRSVFKFLMSVGGNFFRSPYLAPLSYRFADFFVKRFLGTDEVFEIGGFKMKKGRTSRLSILTGEIEPATTDLINNEVKVGMNVFDLGANIGWFTLLFSKLVGDSGHVYSFEPDPQLFKTLQENVELNMLHNVSIFPFAVSNKSGISKFSLNTMQDGDNRLESTTMKKNAIDIQTITLDEFCDKNSLRLDFIKMDIQGSEPKVFEGMKKLVASNPKIKIITEFYPLAIIDVGSSPEDFLNSLEQSGFRIKEIGEGKFVQLKPIKKEKLVKMKNKWPNLYCYKDDF